MRTISVLLGIILLGVLGCSPASEPQTLKVRSQEFGIHGHFQVESNPDGIDSLYPMYPNPFSRGSGDSLIAVTFSVKDSAQVILLIQNPLGDEVVRFRDSLLFGGVYRGLWDPIASDGVPLNAGMYFITLNINSRNYINSRLLYIQNNS